MTADATIDYEGLHQEALRGLVRSILTDVAKNGLPGDHHFYISYDVRSAGVGLSKRLREKYPTEMTIVLQHRFWDLAVNDERFEVKLTFDSIPERLVVPFSAIKVFLDPSVRFVLHFEDAAALSDRDGPRDDVGEPGDGRPAGSRKRVPRGKPRVERGGAIGGPVPLSIASLDKSGERRPALPRPKTAPSLVPTALPAANAQRPDLPATANGDTPSGVDKKSTLPAATSPADGGAAAAGAGTGAQVVSLDAFRKK